ncbi:hypothetical protein GQX73_g5363 [Xylaria multiplex]|uniref:Uncharacterized protein n=1 Tax=Xylaria multiplex TaxID=323545 RepID=A0A7C8INF9_9PEZI|nr:hypothetical protein GQX73_g5363 [Xylaria multiplex]
MFGIMIKALRHPGLAFERTSLLSNEKLATRFKAAVIGRTDHIGLEDLLLDVEKRLKTIFSICLQHREFYTAASGSEVFWGIASEQWDTLEHVDSDEVAAFVQACEVARENCDPGIPTGELSDMVDEFIKMHKSMLAQGPEKHFKVSLFPLAISQASPEHLNSAIRNYITTAVPLWPPSYFTEQEAAWLCHNHVLSQIYGLTTCMDITKADDFPQVPDAYAHPLDIRIFLAFIGLVNLSADRKISLCMTPITFWDDDERRDWHLATGGASKFCWTTWEFCQWAREEFGRGREVVIGLYPKSTASPKKTPGSGLKNHSTLSGTPDEMFISRKRLLADPAYYEDKYDIYANSGMDFKSAFFQDVESHFHITSFWYGGEVPNAFADFGIPLRDSVSTSCSFIALAVQGRIPQSGLDDERWSFSEEIPEKMRYWEIQDEEEEHELVEEVEGEEEGDTDSELESSGNDTERIGQALAELIAQTSNRVVATARKPSSLLSIPTNERVLKLGLDVNSNASIDAALDATLKKFGRIDVVVNNAGYTLVGDTESAGDAESRAIMDTNFWGVVNVSKRALGIMRDVNAKNGQQGGVIVNMSSMGGWSGYPGGSFYHASKFAVEGWTESVAKELPSSWNTNGVDHLVHLCNIEPGGVKTNYATSSLKNMAERHPAYNDPSYPTNLLLSYMSSEHGRSLWAEPSALAAAIYQVVSRGSRIPIRVPLGADAWGMIAKDLEDIKKDLDDLKDISLGVGDPKQLETINFLK